MGLKRVYLADGPLRAFLPGFLKADAVTIGIEGVQKVLVGFYRFGNEVAHGRFKDRPALRVIRVQQGIAAPTLKNRREFPAQVARIFQTGINTIAAIGRVAVRCIAGNEQPACAVGVSDGKAQIPKTDVFHFNFKFSTYRLMQIRLEIKVVSACTGGYRCVKKPGVAKINTPEKLPVTAQTGLQHVVKRFAGIAFQQRVQLMRAKHQQNHQAVVVGQCLRDAGLLAHFGAAAVTAHRKGGPECASLLALALGHRDADTVIVLRDGLCIPAEQRLHRWQLGQALTQHIFSCVLRQAFVGAKIIGLDQLALQPVVGIFS